MKYRNQVEFCVWGRKALFSDPLTRVGGEKFSYSVPTYQALKGIVESVYWKPSFIWYVDEVRVMMPISTHSEGVRTIKYVGHGNDLSIYTYLSDVRYHVRAHFEWNENRPELSCDRNEDKHYQIAKRMIERGGRRDIFLGTRECQGYVEPCDFTEGTGAYDSVPAIPFGVMFHSFSYPDENSEGKLLSRLWTPVMDKGVIRFCRPEECTVVREIGGYKLKNFRINTNMNGIDSEYSDVFGKTEGDI